MGPLNDAASRRIAIHFLVPPFLGLPDLLMVLPLLVYALDEIDPILEAIVVDLSFHNAEESDLLISNADTGLVEEDDLQAEVAIADVAGVYIGLLGMELHELEHSHVPACDRYYLQHEVLRQSSRAHQFKSQFLLCIKSAY